jgi:hypothetical protein
LPYPPPSGPEYNAFHIRLEVLTFRVDLISGAGHFQASAMVAGTILSCG